MRRLLLVSMLLAAVVTSLLLGYPPTYYVYMVHEILLGLVFLWLITIKFLKYLEKPLEILTLFLFFFIIVLSPINTLLAPDYESHFKDPLTHVDALVEIGERPYKSENERRAAEYVEETLEKKGFSPVTDDNVIAVIEGKKEDSVIFCAHYDTVFGSPGADDNASGAAVLLGLEVPENPENTIVIAFFTGEEVGFLGSESFATTFQRDIIAVICVDTVGVGEDIHESSLKKNRVTSFFLSQLVYGLDERALPSIGPLYSDHVPFNERGIRAVGLTRSTDREYPHIHSKRDRFVDEKKIIETGEIVEKVVIHFSCSENPYSFVYEGLIISGFLSGFFTFGFSRIIDRMGVKHTT